MTVAVIDKYKKLLKIYDSNAEFTWGNCEEVITKADIIHLDNDAWKVIGEKEIWMPYFPYFDDDVFFTRKSAEKYVKENRYFKMSDIKKVLFWYEVKGDKARLIETKDYKATLYGFTVMDYRREV